MQKGQFSLTKDGVYGKIAQRIGKPRRVFAGSFLLFGIVYDTALSDHIYFDLSGIFQFSLNLLGDISRKEYHIRIIDLFRNYHYTNLSTCLNSKRFVYTFEIVCDVF